MPIERTMRERCSGAAWQIQKVLSPTKPNSSASGTASANASTQANGPAKASCTAMSEPTSPQAAR